MAAAVLTVCANGATSGNDEVRLVTLDPGHFHAALFQKEMLPGVARRVHVYAPAGRDLDAHLARIKGFNERAQNPTSWESEVYAAPDFFPRLLADRPGNVVVVSGNNRGKIARIEAIVRAGMHTLADKPWIIEPDELPALERTLSLARQNRVVAYDAMTQRFEVTCLLQKALVNDPEVFGTCLEGTSDYPAVYMDSVHYLKKEVAGAPLLRPAWFFDAQQLGEPLADVGTHLVDLVQWMLAPETVIDPRRDVVVLEGRRKVVPLTRAQFKGVTGVTEFPPYLARAVHGDRLDYVAENRVSYRFRGVHVMLDVRWGYEAPAGGKDTELAVFRGSRARVEVRQGREENYVPEVNVFPNRWSDHAAIEAALRERLCHVPGTRGCFGLQTLAQGYRIVIPDAERAGHEAHFALLVRQFLTYLKNPDSIPAWEEPFMLAKYLVTTEGVRLGRLDAAAQRTAMAP